MKLLLLILLIISLIMVSMFVGTAIKQNEIEKRAYKMKKECYTNQDIEVIIFGEDTGVSLEFEDNEILID